MLSFSVDRNGRVLAHEIVRSSGHPELDKEVVSMIERAQPLPPFPPSMPQAKLDLTVPIRFSLR
jgi:protein TonB